jgi:hypothetical protein
MEGGVTNPSTYSDELQKSWLQTAIRQGLLCLICSQPPSLEHRAQFYDTGLCEACTREELSRAAAAPSA